MATIKSKGIINHGSSGSYSTGPTDDAQLVRKNKLNSTMYFILLFILVPREGLEPPLLSEVDFESTASTISPPGQSVLYYNQIQILLTKLGASGRTRTGTPYSLKDLCTI